MIDSDERSQLISALMKFNFEMRIRVLVAHPKAVKRKPKEFSAYGILMMGKIEAVSSIFSHLK